MGFVVVPKGQTIEQVDLSNSLIPLGSTNKLIGEVVKSQAQPTALNAKANPDTGQKTSGALSLLVSSLIVLCGLLLASICKKDFIKKR